MWTTGKCLEMLFEEPYFGNLLICIKRVQVHLCLFDQNISTVSHKSFPEQLRLNSNHYSSTLWIYCGDLSLYFSLTADVQMW